MIAQNEKKLGVWMSTSLVLGNMVGSGIFLLPSILGHYGGISVIGWIIATIGAICFALIFSQLSQAYPNTGGLYIFCKKEFGEALGFLLAWCYWVSICIGTAAIVTSFSSYTSYFFPILKNNIFSVCFSLFSLWTLTLINAHSVYSGGIIQLITTILKIAPIFVISLFGLSELNLDHFTPFNYSTVSSDNGSSYLAAILATGSITLWAFLGLECASIPAGSIKNPKRTIAIATILGTLIAGIIYTISYISILGLISPKVLSQSNAPFTDASYLLWGKTGAFIIGIGACIACAGAVNGWILVQGQMAYAIASDKLLPNFLTNKSRKDAPNAAIITSSCISSAVILLNMNDSVIEIFKFALELSTITTLLAFLFCTAARMLLLARYDNGEIKSGSKAYITIIVIICLVAFIYGLIALANYNEKIVAYSLITLLTGLPVYAWVKARL